MESDILATLRSERDALLREIAHLVRTRDAYDLVIARHQDESGQEKQERPLDSPVEQQQQRLTASAAVQRSFQGRDDWLTVAQVLDRMLAAGWTTTSKAPVNVVRNQLLDLARRGDLEQSKGADLLLRFRKASGRTEAPALTGASGEFTDREEVMGNDKELDSIRS